MAYLKRTPVRERAPPSYDSRTDSYLANQGSPQRVLRRERKEKRRAEQEGRVHNLIVHAIQNSDSREEAAKYLAEAAGLKQEEVYKALSPETFDRVKSSSETPPVDYKFFAGLFRELASNGKTIAAAVMLPLVGYAAMKIAKEPGWGAAAESSEHGRAPDSWGALAQDYQDLKTVMDSALADGQLSVSERGEIQTKVSALQAAQTQSMLNYLTWLAENQTKEGENVSVVSNPGNQFIRDQPTTHPASVAFYNLRDQILPARDSNLQGAGVDKPTAANYTFLNRLYQSMEEMAKAHLKNDAAVAEMDQTKTTVGPDKVSDIGTTPERTSEPLSKLMKQLYDADANDEDTFTEFLSAWLEAPDTWDFVNGVWKENPVQVLRAVRDFYASRIAPVPYNTAVTDWAPVEKPINNPPVIDETSLAEEGTVKHGYRTDANASDADGDTLTHRIISGPTGMEIDPETGEISWMPTIGQIGENRVVIGVSDGKEEKTYEWIVGITSGNAKPVINPSSLSTEGSTRYGYDSQVGASDADGDALTYRIARGPSGMSIDSKTGRINWQPTQNQMGEHEVAVGVSDGMDEVEHSWILNIGTGNRGPVVNEQEILKAGETRHLYHQKFFVDDPDGDRVTSKIIQAPKGASLDPDTHTLTWMPNRTQTGNHTFVLEFTDGEKPMRIQYEVRIDSDNKAPKIIGQPTLLVREGTRWVPSVEITDPDGDPLTYELYLNGKLRANELSWTPGAEDIGRTQYKLVVRDNFGGSAEISGEGNVLQTFPPNVQAPPTVVLEKGKTARVLLPEKDSQDLSLTYTIKNAPPGVEISINGRELFIKGLGKASDSVKVSVNNTVKESELDVYYQVKEKVITPNQLPYYLAAGVLIAGAGVGGTYAAFRSGRSISVERTIGMKDGRIFGKWDKKGAKVEARDDDLVASLLDAMKSFADDTLKSVSKRPSFKALDYSDERGGGKMMVQRVDRTAVATFVRTNKPKYIRATEKALKIAASMASRHLKDWEGDDDSPGVLAAVSDVEAVIYKKRLTLRDWFKSLASAAGADEAFNRLFEAEEYRIPIISAPSTRRIPAGATYSKPPEKIDPLLARIPEAVVPPASPPPVISPPAQKPTQAKPPVVSPAPKPELTRERKLEIFGWAIESSSTPREAVRKLAVGLGAVGRESEIRRTLSDEEFYKLKKVPAPVEKKIAPPDDGGRALLGRITSSLPSSSPPPKPARESANLERVIERSLTYADAVAEISIMTGKPPADVRKKFSRELFERAKAAYPIGLSAHETDSGVRAGETVIDPNDIRKRRLPNVDPNSPLGRLLSEF